MEPLYLEFKRFQSSMVKAHTKPLLSESLVLPKPVKVGETYMFPCKVHTVGGFEHIVSGVPMNVNLDKVDFKAKGGFLESERLFTPSELQQAYDRAFSYGRTPGASREPLFRFSVEGIIGCGAFGSTFLAVDNLSEPPRKVAIKVVMKPEHGYMGLREALSLKWFQRKVNGLVSSGTKKTMTLLSTFYQQERFCLVLELLENLPIHTYSLKPPKPHCPSSIDGWQPIGKSPDQAKRLKYLAKVTFQIMAGVSHLHSQGVIHSDLKPDNILRDPTNPSNIKIADFGNCIIFDQLKKYKGISEVQTESHRAPELLAGLPFGRPADMWSIGIILCQAILGKNPFHVPGSTSKTLAKIVEILGGLPENPYGKATRCSPDLIAPDPDALKKGVKADRKKTVYSFSTAVRTMRLAAVLGLDKSEPVVGFITELLHLDPSRRLTCLKAFIHPFLSDLVGLDLKSLLNNSAPLDDSGIPIPKTKPKPSQPKPAKPAKPVYSTPPRTLSTLTSNLPDTKPGFDYDDLPSVTTLSPGSDIFSRATSKASVHSVATSKASSSLNHKLGRFSIRSSSLSNTVNKNPVPHSPIAQTKTIKVNTTPVLHNIILETTPPITLKSKSTHQNFIIDNPDLNQPPDSLADLDYEANDPQFSNSLDTPAKTVSERNFSRTSKILANLDSVSDLSFGLLDIDDKSLINNSLIITPVKRNFKHLESNGPLPVDKRNKFNLLEPSPGPHPISKTKLGLSPSTSTLPLSSSSGEFVLTHIRRQAAAPPATNPIPGSQSTALVHDSLKEDAPKQVVFGKVYNSQNETCRLKPCSNLQFSLPQTLSNRPAFTYPSQKPSRIIPRSLDYCCTDDIILVPSKPTSDN